MAPRMWIVSGRLAGASAEIKHWAIIYMTNREDGTMQDDDRPALKIEITEEVFSAVERAIDDARQVPWEASSWELARAACNAMAEIGSLGSPC